MTRRLPYFKCLCLLVLGLVLSGCTTISNFFSMSKDNTQKPSPLVAFQPTASVHTLWSTNPSGKSGKYYIKLNIGHANGILYVAGYSGTVSAVASQNGRVLWTVKSKVPITAGPSAGNGLVFFGSSDGRLVALNQSNGQQQWSAKLTNQILAAPYASRQGIVLTKTIDGVVTAFAAKTGKTLWSYESPAPGLILRGASSPTSSGNVAVVGFANGKVAALQLHGGQLLWQHPLTTPVGSTPLQQLADIDANPVIAGGDIYVTGYQGYLAALGINHGQEFWKHKMSSYTGLVLDNSKIYVSDAKGHVWALGRQTGSVAWRQKKLEARILSAPAVMGRYVAVGDAEGYLHWMATNDGHFVARIKVNDSGIRSNPLVMNNTLYVLSLDGELSAYRVAR